MVQEAMDFITAADPEVGRAIQAEYDRQQQNIELIASENVVSSAVLAAAGTVLTNKYAEGYPAKRYYGGCQTSPSSGPGSSSAPALPMYSPIPAHRQTTLSTKPSASMATPSWA